MVYCLRHKELATDDDADAENCLELRFKMIAEENLHVVNDHGSDHDDLKTYLTIHNKSFKLRLGCSIHNIQLINQDICQINHRGQGDDQKTTFQHSKISYLSQIWLCLHEFVGELTYIFCGRTADATIIYNSRLLGHRSGEPASYLW